MTRHFNGTSNADYLNASTLEEAISARMWAGNDIVVGSAFGDFIDGGRGSNTLSGGAGDDTIYTGAQEFDTVYGGAGNDRIHSDGNAFLAGGTGDDTYLLTLMKNQYGSTGLQIWEAEGEGYDRVRAVAFDGITASFEGGDYGHVEHIEIRSYLANPDPEAGPAQGIRIIGGGLIDNLITANFVTAPQGGSARIEGKGGDDTIQGSGTRFVLDGGNGDDRLDAGAANDRLLGGSGNDSLFGGMGADTLEGGHHNDTLDGGGGADSMVGGAGDDTYYVDEAGDRVIEAAFGGTDMVVSGLSAYALGAQLENLSYTGFSGFLGTGNDLGNRITGGLLGDTLRGGAGQDYLFGQLGNDLLEGGLDSDSLFGDFGADTLDGGGSWDFLDGGQGRDLLLGGEGGDRLTGGAGADTLTGGAGADRFVFGEAAHSTVAARDVVTDFAKGGIDLIDLSAIDANTLLAGNQAFAWLGRTQDVDPAGRPMAGSLWARENASGTELRADLNGDGVVDFSVKLNGAWWLSAADIVL